MFSIICDSVNYLSITFQSQLPNGDEHYNYQVGDNELYKITAFDKLGKQLLKYLPKGNAPFGSRLFVTFF